LDPLRKDSLNKREKREILEYKKEKIHSPKKKKKRRGVRVFHREKLPENI